MSSNEIVSEPEYLRSVGTFDSLSTEVNPKDSQDDESPVKKVLGRIQEGAAAIFSCGKAGDVDDKQEKVKSSTESI
ncbi:unnamed protein product [Cylindrotheca closterium]|uniref:Uncharacterized protein n=1 Tax=Cylindrotheca closterium TaxID=2856 RepID=A0AAD2PUL5_9STRA|nr:unnamed protein product [Cylindrotheca closterium]